MGTRAAMDRRTLLIASLATSIIPTGSVAVCPARSIPVPRWRPTFAPPIADIVDRVRYYTDKKRDFAVFQNGTCAMLELDLPDAAATVRAVDILLAIYGFHPDMTPVTMD